MLLSNIPDNPISLKKKQNRQNQKPAAVVNISGSYVKYFQEMPYTKTYIILRCCKWMCLTDEFKQVCICSRCFCADIDDFRNEFKVPPFQDCILSFLGFSDEEKNSMEEMTEMQGKMAAAQRQGSEHG